MKQIKAIIFDFDGVILDSSKDICNAVNHTLSAYGEQPLSRDQIIKNVGDGATELLRKSFLEAHPGLDVTPRMKSEIYPTYLSYYMEHCADESELYEGLEEMLKGLRAAGVPCSIVTNKPEPLTKKICRALDIEKYFQLIIGPESLTRMKPDPEGLTLCINHFGVPADQTLMIGDGNTDIFAGQAAGAQTCAVLFGLGNRDDLLAAGPDYRIAQLTELLGMLSP